MIMLGALFGLGAALCWGTSDFVGGLQSRRFPVLTVALWSQIAGALALLLVIAVMWVPPVLPSVLWGIAGGILGGIALLLFYRGLAVGTMSVVAPISACGAVIPVLVAVASGEPPSAIASLGIVAAISGVVLVSRQTGSDARSSPASIWLALGAALGFGLLYVCFDRGSNVPGSSPLWVVVAGRCGSLVMLIGLLVISRRPTPWPGRHIGAIAAVGVGDTLANLLFVYASRLGNLGVVAVLASLFPVATVLLGWFILSERLTRPQYVGVALALTGVVLLAGG
jgi:drug/metabolite transporter (DMT)-like permease